MFVLRYSKKKHTNKMNYDFVEILLLQHIITSLEKILHSSENIEKQVKDTALFYKDLKEKYETYLNTTRVFVA